MSTISGLGGGNRPWGHTQSGESRKAEHEARLFAKVDSDGSGGVDATELASMLEKGPLSGPSGDSTELLKKMDGNGDGSLSSDELSQGMRALMPPPASTLDFAQSRGAANDDAAFDGLDTDGDGQLSRAEFKAGRPSGPPPGGMPPAASSSTATTTTAATSTDYDPLDVNQDGTVSQLERLAGQLKELAKSGADDSGQGGANTEIAALAQKLYDQIARNWLPAGTSDAVSTTA